MYPYREPPYVVLLTACEACGEVNTHLTIDCQFLSEPMRIAIVLEAASVAMLRVADAFITRILSRGPFPA